MTIKPPIPPDLQALADEAQARKDAAIERLRSLALDEDPFLDSVAELIDADKKVVHLRRGGG